MKPFWWKSPMALLPAVGIWAALVAGEDTGKEPRDTLPIYRLGAPEVDERAVNDLARRAFAVTEGELDKGAERLTARSGKQVVEVYRKSGGVWAADEAALWNPDLKPDLPDAEQARALADMFLASGKWLPQAEDAPYRVEFKGQGGTRVSTFDFARKRRVDRRLDVQVTYAARMRIPRKDADPLTLPVVGGGGEYGVTLGAGGKVVGFSGVWRPIAKVEMHSPVIPREQADKQFKEMVKCLKVRSFEATLAYYAAPAPLEQKFLYPVYVYRAQAAAPGGMTFPLRAVLLPATEFGPKLPVPKPRPPRTEKSTPLRRSLLPERKGEAEGGTGPEGTKGLALPLANLREAGASWIGPLGGLPHSQANAQGFEDGLRDDGWAINFNWGDEDAWESDWRKQDDSWVDAADLVFYTGHALHLGWMLSEPEDNFLMTGEAGAAPGTPGDLWGQQDLEWIVIAACGPLHDEVIVKGGGDVFKQWGGAFDGLHLLMGYAAATRDNEEEGRTFVKYAREGQPLIQAWFRAAREIQDSDNGQSPPNGPTIYVGVLYAERAGQPSPSNDHLWGHGSVAPDPKPATTLVAIWSPT